MLWGIETRRRWTARLITNLVSRQNAGMRKLTASLKFKSGMVPNAYLHSSVSQYSGTTVVDAYHKSFRLRVPQRRYVKGTLKEKKREQDLI